MIPLHKISGRLGNQMFQFAFCYAKAREMGVDYYFQDPVWFEDYEHEIKRLYGKDIPPRTDMVAIHVRRGDYVDNDFYVDLMKTPYYEDAMALFPDDSFLVFSDDIEWCKKQLIFKGCEFSEGLNEIDDLNLMASCKAHIIANSSYSWWGSFISPYSEKTIAPNVDKWYNDGIERTVCPEDWLRI